MKMRYFLLLLFSITPLVSYCQSATNVTQKRTEDFAVIEDLPLFPGCERVKKKNRRACFQRMINAHVKNHYRYPTAAFRNGIQGTVYVNFIIEKDGSISNIRTDGADRRLLKEATRIVLLLPTMIPGKQKGIPVRVPFSFPIIFSIN